MIHRLVVATRNRGKLEEIAAGLAGLPVELVTLADFPTAPDVEENGSTYGDNARLKAVSAARHTCLPALADDTGLEVQCLNGHPGLHSARYAGPDGNSAANRARLLEALRDRPEAERGARFRCVLALAYPLCLPRATAVTPRSFDVVVDYYQGVVEGTIAMEPRGHSGFGYDPIFVVTEVGRTMAELSLDEKNRLSHRGRALALLRNLLAQHG